MLSGVIEWSLANRAMVIALFVLMALGGLYAATQIPVDAVPDLVNIQVQVVTEVGTLPPLEVERLVTYPVELAVSGLPDVVETRSISRLGISLVTIVFREGTDILRARQLVVEDIEKVVVRSLPYMSICRSIFLKSNAGAIVSINAVAMMRGRGSSALLTAS